MLKCTNFVAATLASSLTDNATTISLTPGDGAQFPVIASGTADTFLIIVTDKNGNREIISICRRESGSDTLYVGSTTDHQASGDVSGRAQENTTALAVTYTDYHSIGMGPLANGYEAAVKYSDAGELTVTTDELNVIHESGVSQADLIKLHETAASAAEINTACDGATARNEHVHTNIGVTASDGLAVSRANLGGSVDIGLADYTAGNRYVFSSLSSYSTSSGSYSKVFEVQLDRGGTLRIAFDLSTHGLSGTTAYGRIYRNGTAVGTARSTTSSSGVTYSQDISGWSAGDLLQIYAYATGDYAATTIRNIYLKSGNVYGLAEVNV